MGSSRGRGTGSSSRSSGTLTLVHATVCSDAGGGFTVARAEHLEVGLVLCALGVRDVEADAVVGVRMHGAGGQRGRCDRCDCCLHRFVVDFELVFRNERLKGGQNRVVDLESEVESAVRCV